MSNNRLAYVLYLMPLFVTTVLLILPIQTQAQTTSAEGSCFPVEPGAVTEMCTEGPESGYQETNATSIKKGTTSTSGVSCFPVEPGAVTEMCTEGPESGYQETNST
jgi:hypothetical protein